VFSRTNESPRFLKQRQHLSYPTISITPIRKQEHPEIFVFLVLEKLVENRSSSIFKVLHQPTGMVYCLKRSEVTRLNLEQLIV
jgi:hypothetical protein